MEESGHGLLEDTAQSDTIHRNAKLFVHPLLLKSSYFEKN
jgi:hypothetical protein